MSKQHYCKLMFAFCIPAMTMVLAGCWSKTDKLVDSKSPVKTLEEILRNEVRHQKKEIESDNQGEFTAMEQVIRIAAKAIESDGTFAGELIEQKVSEANGIRTFVVSWKKTLDFTLGSKTADTQEIFWESPSGMSGTIVNIDSNPDGQLDSNCSEFADTESRLKGKKNFCLNDRDPLHQALTLSGYPDSVMVSDIGNGKYQAEIETRKATIVVDAMKVKSVSLANK